MRFPSVAWSDAEVERAVHLWNVDGLSCAKIAETLHAEFRTARSRCAVAGLINRKSLLFDARQGKDGRPIGHVAKVREAPKRKASDALLSHEIAFAADLWNRGQPATRIVEVIADRFGKSITRDLIRKLVAERPKLFAPRKKGEQQQGRASAPAIVANRDRPDAYQAPITKYEARAYDLESRRLPLADLDWSDCRFPVNEAARGETHLFCGRPALGGKVLYCAHHAQRAVGSGTLGEQRAERDLRFEAKRAA